MSSTANGFKFKIGKYKIRIWKYGYEFGDNLGGRVYLFPWHPFKRRLRKALKPDNHKPGM